MTRLTPAVNAAKQALKKAESTAKATAENSNQLLSKEMPFYGEEVLEQTNFSHPRYSRLTQKHFQQAKLENDHLSLNQTPAGKDLTTRPQRKQYVKAITANATSPATEQLIKGGVYAVLDNAKAKVKQFFSKLLSPFKGIYNFFKNAGQKIFGKKAEAATTGNEATATETKNAKTPKTTMLKTD